MAKQDITIELFYDAAWQNVTSDVYARDGIQITHGRASAEDDLSPSSCQLTFDNRGAKYHPRNANSPLFGKIGRNTPLRVRLGASDVRFAGEVATWRPGRDLDGNDSWVEVTANGVSRRLGQGATPLRSAPYRYAVNHNVYAYWPLDDMTRADFGAPGVGRYDFEFRRKGSSAIKPGEGELGPWLPNGVKLEETTLGTVLEGFVNMAPSDSVFQWAVDVAYAGDAIGVFAFSVYTKDVGSNQVIWRVRLDPGTGQLTLRWKTDGENSSEAVLETLTPASAFDGNLHVLRLQLDHQAEASLANYQVFLDGVSLVSGNTNPTAVSALGVSKIRLTGTTGSGSSSVNYGHVAVWGGDVSPGSYSIATAADWSAAVFGHQGETAGSRFTRLAAENGLTATVFGTVADTAPLGPQYAEALLDILRDAANTDLGILWDTLDVVGLSYRCRPNLYNRTAALTLDFAGLQVSPPLEPAVDDLDIRNDVTATRRDGTSARAILTSGRLSTAAPPAGVGTYDDQVTVNTAGEGKMLEDQAGWRLHLGTVDDDRFPRVSVDLDANPGLAATVAALRVGNRLALTNLPDHLSVDDASLIIQGWTEQLETHRRVVTFNCSPETPWRVAVYQSAVGSTVHKYDTGGSTLSALVTSTATSLSVATGTGHPLWTADDAEDGFDIECEGERMTVTDIAGSSSPQTFTVTRSINGVVKGHGSGAAVRLWQPPTIAL